MKIETSDFFSRGKISFPITRAFAFSLKSIRIRLGRMLIVLIGVASAIAFMTMLFSMAVFTGEVAEAEGVDTDELWEEADQPYPAESVILHPSRVMEAYAEDTLDSAAVARAFRPWWLVIALGISVAGITNAVLMSVTERIKEIGTLKCLGAMSYHIVEIFLFESVLIGLIGGAIGSIVGIGFAMLNLLLSGAEEAGLHLPSAAQLFGTFVAGMLFSVIIALTASVVPVVIAARIQPADAMRYEV